MEDYAELEGKEVIFVESTGNKIILMVAGCDPDIGLTLYKKGDKEDNRICLNGPMSPKYKADKQDGFKERVYKAMFDFIVDGINHGSINSLEVLNVKSVASNTRCGFAGYNIECAFNQ